jgi:hypothetical protein
VITTVQGLSADGAKVALWWCFLQGYCAVAFIHDEIIFELPLDSNLQAFVHDIERLMVNAMQSVMPLVRVSVEGALFTRWDKGAKPIFNRKGDQLIWTPDIIVPDKGKKDDPLHDLFTKRENEDPEVFLGRIEAGKPPMTRTVWQPGLVKPHGFQPLASILDVEYN